MKRLRTTRSFEKDFKKFGLSVELIDVLHHLLNGTPMPERYRDHPLINDFKGCRDCHVKPDLVLIYQVDAEVVTLMRLNSHSEIFG